MLDRIGDDVSEGAGDLTAIDPCHDSGVGDIDCDAAFPQQAIQAGNDLPGEPDEVHVLGTALERCGLGLRQLAELRDDPG